MSVYDRLPRLRNAYSPARISPAFVATLSAKHASASSCAALLAITSVVAAASDTSHAAANVDCRL